MVSNKKFTHPLRAVVRSSRLGWGHSHRPAAAGLPREQRRPGAGPQPTATCPRWSLAICAEAGTARAGGLTSGGNEVSRSQRREGTTGGDDGAQTGLFTFPAAINGLHVPAQQRRASHTSSVPGGGEFPFQLPTGDGREEMGQGSAGVPSTFLQRGASLAVLDVPLISQQGIWGHPFLSQPWASHDGGDLHGAIAKGMVMGHLWHCTRPRVPGSHCSFPVWV